MEIVVDDPSVVMLVGPAGAGKSTFARSHFRDSEVLSSDTCRELVSDDPTDQSATADAFAVLHAILQRRLARGRLSVVDATNVEPHARRPILDLARRYGVGVLAIVFDASIETCIRRRREGAAAVDEAVIRSQRYSLDRWLDDLGSEGVDRVVILKEDNVGGISITRRAAARGFSDNFSEVAEGYSKFRPGYPAELIAWLASQAPSHQCAWDCATGNGQAALLLASHFDVVMATDASARQIERARSHRRVRYSVAPAERSGLEDHSVDLITVAQALHWFDLEAFYREVARVAVAGAVIAVWTYDLVRVSPLIDRCLQRFYHEEVGEYWSAHRRHVESGYRTLSFPFEEIEPPEFYMSDVWEFGQLLGYVRTWSAVQRYVAERGEDPVDRLERELVSMWDVGSMKVTWPLKVRAGRVRVLDG
jgi:predicted kinase/ubiquinone/menaquinone biosynthesis C-methylase UbiE